MPIDPHMMKQSLATGLAKGWRSYLWAIKILVPISLVTVLMHHSGVITYLDLLFRPLMNPLGLPGEAALPILIALTAGFYPALAAIAALPFTLAQITLMANFILLAHNLIQEGVVQAKSGFPAWKAIGVRLLTAGLTVMVCSWFMENTTQAIVSQTAAAQSGLDFWARILAWAEDTAWLCLNILIIVLFVYLFIQTIKDCGWERGLILPLKPVLAFLGVSQKAGFIWAAAVIFGLTYAAAVVVEESKSGYLSQAELEDLQLSIGLNHSVLEDSIIFMSLGCSLFWIALPRLLAAGLVVHLTRLARRFRSRIP